MAHSTTNSPWPNIPHEIGLREHENGGRDKCVALEFRAAGSVILSTSPLATVLLPSEKGKRCDYCFSSAENLRRCSGCASFWYCGSECQNAQWNDQHKKICKKLNTWQVSSAYQSLSAHQKLDAILLSHLLSAFLLSPDGYSEENNSITAKFLSLLPFQDDPMVVSAIYPLKPGPPKDFISRVNARFGNNNFAIHSHLTTVGHGVFPLASRIFNHSCVPNAAARYRFRANSPPEMQVVALRDIKSGEEICIPYVDPALLETRQQIFRFSYGFDCTCNSCQSLGEIGPVPKSPADPAKISYLATGLCNLASAKITSDTPLHPKMFSTIPKELRPVLTESFIQTLSENFSAASHEGDFHSAQSAGKTLLALYTLIYPPNYPQIGMHLLEMTKTVWNHIITSEESHDNSIKPLEEEARQLLSAAKHILDVYGPEGDEDSGPLQELNVLSTLLNT